MRIAAFAAVLLIAFAPPARGARGNADPDAARLVTEDVVRFWQVADRATPERLPELLQRDYIDLGTEGLRGFIPNRIVSAEALARKFLAERKAYDASRVSSLALAGAERAIRAPFYALKHLYPDAVFPNVYFVVGRLNSGGTVSDAGLLIGAELYKDATEVPHIVAHELIHFQQPGIPDGERTLLAQAIHEGSADFLAELISGRHINAAAHAYGRANEAALWSEFQRAMSGRELGDWFYRKPPGERPADLGYFVGYRIVEAYYRQAPDKRRAIREILTSRNPEDLLRRSGYSP